LEVDDLEVVDWAGKMEVVEAREVVEKEKTEHIFSHNIRQEDLEEKEEETEKVEEA
jgi:hypothetical protein